MSWVVRNKAQKVFILLFALGLGGCSLAPVNGYGTAYGVQARPFTKAASQSLLPASLGQFFEQAPPGATISVADSPWGDNVEITAAATYDAASGRKCRDITIMVDGSAPMHGIVCRVRQGQWESVRPIARAQGALTPGL